MKHIPHNVLTFIMFLIGIGLIYHSVITVDYLFHDDVNFFTRTESRVMPPSQLFNFFVGRFLGAVIMTVLSWKTHVIADLIFIRAIALLQIALSATILYIFLREYFRNRIHTFLSVLLIITLPGFQIMSAYAGIIFHSSALLLASLAAFCTFKIHVGKSPLSRLLDLYTILGVILFWMALTTYASTAMFYWVFLFIVILASIHKPQYDLKRRLFDFYLVGLVGIALYGITLKLFEPMAHRFLYGMYNPYSIDLNVVEKVKWFFKEPFLNVLNLWNVFPSIIVAIAVLSFILLTAIFNLYLLSKMRPQKFDALQTSFNIVFLVIILGSVIALSFLPSLLATGEAAFYRCTVNLAAIVVLTLIWCITRWFTLMPLGLRSHFLTVVLTLLCFFAIMKASSNVYWLRVYPSKVELSFIKENVLSSPQGSIKHIHVIEPDKNLTPERYDEFVTPTARYDQDVVGLLTSAFVDISSQTMRLVDLKYIPRAHIVMYAFALRTNNKLVPYVVHITSAQKEFGAPMQKDMITIDMNSLYRPGGKLNYLTKL